jgi:osmoprotectant transport system substrate-binding protein
MGHQPDEIADTPIHDIQSKGEESMRKITALALIIFFVLASATTPTQAQDKQTIRVGSKEFTEQFVLGQLIILALENAGFTVVDRTNLGGSAVNREALVNGEIDVYPEYTGTAISNYFREVENANIPDKASGNAYASFALVSSLDAAVNDLIWLQPAPANNTYALAVKRAFAEEHGLKSLADLAKYVKDGKSIVLATNDEFAQRPDGLASFQKLYGFTLKEDQLLVIAGGTPAQTSQALNEGRNNVNVAMVFGTDGALKAYNFVVLSDELGAQPVFQPAPVLRGSVLRANPKIAGILNPIFATLDAPTLQDLNAAVEVDGKRPKDVALKYLKDKKFIS